MNNESYQTQVDTQVEIGSEFKMDKYRFLKLKMYLGHTGLNSNSYYISEEVFTKALPTLSNIPIVAKLNPINGDFEGHNHYEDSSGNIIRDTDVMGVIPETNNARFEVRNDLSSDGVARKYLVVDGLLWTRNLDLMQAIVDKKGVLKNSLEMKVDSTLDENSNIKTVHSIVFEALCFLGDSIGEGMKGSKSFLVNFSEEEKISEDTIQKALAILNNNEKGAMKKMEDTTKVNFEESPVTVDGGEDNTSTDETNTNVEAQTTEDAQQDAQQETETPVDNESDTEAELEPEAEPTEEDVQEDGQEGAKTEEEEKDKEEEIPPTVEEPEEPVQKPEEELIPISTYTVLKTEKKRLEDKYKETTALFEAQKAELEQLRAYRMERESADLRAEFSSTLPMAKVTEVIEAKKSEGLDKVREALFAELGKSFLSNSVGVANFSAKPLNQDTFMVPTTEKQDEQKYGKFGEM